MSELNERLEQLANRGTRRGADAVLDAALTNARMADSRNGHGDGGAGVVAAGDLEAVDPTSDDGPPVVSMYEARKTRRPWRTAITAGGLAALLGVGTLGIVSMMDGGGAQTPEDAVDRLADAIEHEDPLAAVAVLAPNEVANLADTVGHVSSRAQELALVNDAARPLAGIDFELSDLSYRTEELAPGYVKVYVDGFAMDTTVRAQEVAERIRRAWDPEEPEVRTSVGDSEIAPEVGVFVVAVQDDGGWYVSPAYTALEYVRTMNDAAPADYGSARAAVATLGADSPEMLVDQALRAWSAGDWEALFRLVPPDELPLYDYRDSLGALLAETEGPGFTIDRLSVSADIAGPTATVTIDAAGTLQSGGSWQVDRNCVEIEEDDFGVDLCGNDRGALFLLAIDNDDLAAPMTAVQREGRWFLSPNRTLLNLVDRLAANVTSDDIAATFGMYEELPVDGTLTLGRPADLLPRAGRPTIFTYEGTAGEELIATATRPQAPGTYVDMYSIMLGPDGREIEDAWGLFQGEPSQLPETGTYRVVVYSYDEDPTTVTLWDTASAPPEAFEPMGECESIDAPEWCGSVMQDSETAEATAPVAPTTAP